MPHGLGHRRPVGKAEVIEANQGQDNGRVRKSCCGSQNLDLISKLEPRCRLPRIDDAEQLT